MVVLRLHPLKDALEVEVGKVFGRTNLKGEVQLSVSRLHFKITGLGEKSAVIQHVSTSADGCVKRKGSDTTECVKGGNEFTLNDGDRYHFVSAWVNFFIEAEIQEGAAGGDESPEPYSPRAVAEDDVEVCEEVAVDNTPLPIAAVVDAIPLKIADVPVVVVVVDTPSPPLIVAEIRVATPATPLPSPKVVADEEVGEESPIINKRRYASSRRWGNPSSPPVDEGGPKSPTDEAPVAVDKPVDEGGPKSPTDKAPVAVDKAPKSKKRNWKKAFKKLIDARPSAPKKVKRNPSRPSAPKKVNRNPPRPSAGGVPKKKRKVSNNDKNGYDMDPAFHDADPIGEARYLRQMTHGAAALVMAFTAKNRVTHGKLMKDSGIATKAGGMVAAIKTLAKDVAAEKSKIIKLGKPTKRLPPILQARFKKTMKKMAEDAVMFSADHSAVDYAEAQAGLAKMAATLAEATAAAAGHAT